MHKIHQEIPLPPKSGHARIKQLGLQGKAAKNTSHQQNHGRIIDLCMLPPGKAGCFWVSDVDVHHLLTQKCILW